MATNVSFNPQLTTNAYGSFSTDSSGFVQGVAFDDPSVRNALAGGVLAATENYPMWGGVGISAVVPSTYQSSGAAASVNGSMGPTIGRATTTTVGTTGQLIGFSTLNQAVNWLTWPQNNVPVASSGMTVPYFPIGSGARIAVAIEPSLASSYAGANIGQALYWDFNAQMLVGNNSASYSVTSLTWSATNGGQVAVVLGAASPVAGVGDTFTIAGVTGNTGTGGITAINGPHVVNTFTDNQHFTFLLPGTSAQWGTISGTITLVYSEGQLPNTVRILRVSSGNSRTVLWDPINQVANWNNNGSAAIIQI
jgi:hypothetical protein